MPCIILICGSIGFFLHGRAAAPAVTSRRRPWPPWTPGGRARQSALSRSWPAPPALAQPRRDPVANHGLEGSRRLPSRAQARQPVCRPAADRRSNSSNRRGPAPTAAVLPRPTPLFLDAPTFVRKSPFRQGALHSRLTLISSTIAVALKPLSPETIKALNTKPDRWGFNMTEPRFFVAVQHVRVWKISHEPRNRRSSAVTNLK